MLSHLVCIELSWYNIVCMSCITCSMLLHSTLSRHIWHTLVSVYDLQPCVSCPPWMLIMCYLKHVSSCCSPAHVALQASWQLLFTQIIKSITQHSTCLQSMHVSVAHTPCTCNALHVNAKAFCTCAAHAWNIADATILLWQCWEFMAKPAMHSLLETMLPPVTDIGHAQKMLWFLQVEDVNQPWQQCTATERVCKCKTFTHSIIQWNASHVR